MRRLKLAAMSACVIGALLAAPTGAEAQCWTCDDDFWTNPSCVPMGWAALGGEICIVDGSSCYTFGGCYGDDPIVLLDIRPDGTVLTASTVPGAEPEAENPVLSAMSAGPAPLALGQVLQQRTCKDLVTARRYGDDVREELERRSSTLVI
jgi:hypothetical protein